jgi:primosomal protein N' (replication factor Y)
MSLYAEIVFPLPVNQSFSYLVPEAFREKAKIGSRVIAPLGHRRLTGFIIDLKESGPPPEFELKEIVDVLDGEPAFSPALLSLTRKLSDYYYSSWGELLQAALPPSFILKSQTKVFLTEEGKVAAEKESLTREEREILDFLDKQARSLSFLKKKLGAQALSRILPRLEKNKLIGFKSVVRRPRKKRVPEDSATQTQLEMDFSLDSESRQLADRIARSSREKIFRPFFLFGSFERREAAYFYLIKKFLAVRKRVLILVPEIPLTRSLTEKFQKRLGEKVAVLHSRLPKSRREGEWRKIKGGEAEVVVGPRSALFSPLTGLGLIIVDEEHDESFAQHENPCYDARRGAWLRAEEEGAVLIYGSACPSVSGFYRAEKGRYLLRLENRARRKNVEIVDDRREKRLISQRLKEKIGRRIKNKEQVLVFFNRRGYASFLFCSRCNYIPRCVRCDIALSYHKRDDELICHYCNYSRPKMETCPVCASRMMSERGVGIEAVEEELRRIFPQNKIASFDTSLTEKDQAKVLKRYRRGEIDVLIGTQLLAHQLELPPASLVSILFPEMILALSDYRAGQRTYQTLSQMMSFAKDDDSEVLIQTALPDHFAIVRAAGGDYDSFYEQELEFRRLMNYPPFSIVVEIMFQGKNLRNVARRSREFSDLLKSLAKEVEILGPALASVPKVRGLYRVQLVLKAQRKDFLDEVLRKSLRTTKLRKSVFVYD